MIARFIVGADVAILSRNSVYQMYRLYKLYKLYELYKLYKQKWYHL